MAQNYIWHVTLNTGDMARIWRGQIDPAFLDAMKQALAKVDRPMTTIQLPGHPGYTLMVSPGKAFIASMHGAGGLPITTFGVALRSKASGMLWAAMFQRAPEGMVAKPSDPAPRTPWLASRVEPSAITDPLAIFASARIGQTIAYAWMELRKGDADG